MPRIRHAAKIAVLAGVVILLGIGGAAFAAVSVSGWPTRFSAERGKPTAPPPAVCAKPDNQISAPQNGVWVGASMDPHVLSVRTYASRIGHAPAVIETSVGLPQSEGDQVALDNAVRSAAETGAVLLLSAEPRSGLDAVTDSMINTLGDQIARAGRSGVRVIVRWAPEMNGSWYPWGQDPKAYVASFRQAGTLIKKKAPNAAMMWVPNYGGGYPFPKPSARRAHTISTHSPDGRYSPAKGSKRYHELDTNHDGVLSAKDDPYAPYWPGEKYVDWVGMSIYYWSESYTAHNSTPKPGMFEAKLRGTYHDSVVDERSVPDFYKTYGVAKGLPVAVPETAAFYVHGEPGPDEISVKKAWWDQVFDPELPQRMPDLKLINWFEWRTKDIRSDVVVDWESTTAERTRAGFVQALPEWAGYAPGHRRC